MPISGRYDLPLATFNLPSRNNLQNKPNSAAPPVQSLRDSAAATPAGGAALRRRFRIFSFRYREMMPIRNDDGGEILSHPLPWSSSRSRNPTQSKHSSVRHITPRAAGSAHDAEDWRGAEKFSRRVWRRIWRISAAVAGALSPSSLRTSRRAFRHSSRIMSPSSERVTGMSGCMGKVWREFGGTGGKHVE